MTMFILSIIAYTYINQYILQARQMIHSIGVTVDRSSRENIVISDTRLGGNIKSE